MSHPIISALVVSTLLSVAWAEDETVTIDQVPAAVKAAILKSAGTNTVAKIEKETKKGKIVYEAEWPDKDGTTEVKIAEDGTVLKTKHEVKDGKEEKEDDEKGEKGEKK